MRQCGHYCGGSSAGGYDKVKFSIKWSDGTVFGGRYDLVHPEASNEIACFGEQARRYFEFSSGLKCPSHMTERQYQQVLNRGGDQDNQLACRQALETLEFSEANQP